MLFCGLIPVTLPSSLLFLTPFAPSAPGHGLTLSGDPATIAGECTSVLCPLHETPACLLVAWDLGLCKLQETPSE